MINNMCNHTAFVYKMAEMLAQLAQLLSLNFTIKIKYVITNPK